MANSRNSYDPKRCYLPKVNLAKTLTGVTDVVLGVIAKDDSFQLVGLTDDITKKLSAEVAAELPNQLRNLGATAKAGVVYLLPAAGLRLTVVGLGTELDLSAEDLRQGAGYALRYLNKQQISAAKVLVSLDAASPATVQAVTEGALLALNQFAKLTAKPTEPKITQLLIASDCTAATEAIKTAQLITESVITARDWADMPPNLLGPSDLVEQARGFCKDQKISIEVLDEKALEKGGYGGILAVGGGSVRPPRLLRLDYAPKSATKHLVLVGKGITYDSGGYNLKPGDSLITMKHDMAGAAATIVATRAIAALGLPVHVTCYAPIAEQMISGTAYRPGDVITMLDGTTVENMNSDCEGRMVLADALVRASRENPDLIVDVATLTGACLVALGKSVAGLMTNQDSAADLVLDAADAAGEDFWQLPITDEVREQLPSQMADLQSKGPTRFGGTLFAAAFLEHFVDPKVAWAHLDIAGPAWHTGAPKHYLREYSTGFSIRTLIELAKSLAN